MSLVCFLPIFSLVILSLYLPPAIILILNLLQFVHKSLCLVVDVIFEIRDCAEGYFESSVVTTPRRYSIGPATPLEVHLALAVAFVGNYAGHLERH